MARAGFTTDQTDGMTRSGVSLTRPLSVSFWLKASSNSDIFASYTHCIYAQSHTSGAPAMLVVLRSSGTVLGLYSGAVLDSSSFTADTSWHQYGIVWLADDSVYFYRDGSALSNSTLAQGGNDGSAGLGSMTAISNMYTQGSLAQFAIWSLDLRSDMPALGKGFHPRLVRPSGLLACPNLVRGDVTDSAGGSWTTNGSPTTTDEPRIIYPRRRQAYSVAAAGGGGVFTPYYYREHIARYAG